MSRRCLDDHLLADGVLDLSGDVRRKYGAARQQMGDDLGFVQ